MELKVFNATRKEIEEKRFNAFIGISLGVLKPLTKEIAKEYISWALEKTKDTVVILIADEIARFNYRIFSGYSEGKAERRAMREGSMYADFFREVIKGFSEEEQKKIHILRWKDIWDERRENIRRILKEEYESNKEFRGKVRFFIEQYAKKRGKRLDEERLDYLSHYIVYELATLLEGIEYRNEKYRLLLYPTFESSGMSDVVTKIQQGEIYPDLKERLNLTEKTVLIETYLDTHREK